MDNINYIKRYFETEEKIMGLNDKIEITLLFNYLNSLHSLNDKLDKKYNKSIREYPEFKFLRLLRNFDYHQDDIDSKYRFFSIKNNTFMIPSHLNMILIPTYTFLYCIKSFLEKHDGKKYAENELNSIKDLNEEFSFFIENKENIDLFLNNTTIQINNKNYELGIDVYKYIYNMSNILVNHLKNIPELKNNEFINNLDESYSIDNLIPKNDLILHPSEVDNYQITTEGVIYYH